MNDHLKPQQKSSPNITYFDDSHNHTFRNTSIYESKETSYRSIKLKISRTYIEDETHMSYMSLFIIFDHRTRKADLIIECSV